MTGIRPTDRTPDVPPLFDYHVARHKADGFATYGRCFDMAGQEIMVTLEKPWVDGDSDGKRDRMLSRFAQGLYTCFLRKSKKNGGTGKRDYDVWQFKSDDGDPSTVDDTPDIDAAQIHIANLPHELDGCIATGTAFGQALDRRDGRMYPGVTASKTAFEKFMKDSLALCAREQRDPPFLRVLVTDDFRPEGRW